MMSEIRNANKGVLKQADRSRILSIKLVNMTGELTLLRRAAVALADQADTAAKKLKKVRGRLAEAEMRIGTNKYI